MLDLRRLGGPSLWGVSALLLAIVASALTGAATITIPPILAGMFVVLMVYGTPLLTALRKPDDDQRRFHLTVDEAGFSVRRAGRPPRGLAWDKTRGVAEVETAFLIQVSPKPLWIPKRQISAEMQQILRTRSRTRRVRRSPR